MVKTNYVLTRGPGIAIQLEAHKLQWLLIVLQFSRALVPKSKFPH
uniref:Uncharacterized protein n=1 Tax=Anguilla anguilla TaxID=7936 RepID=A0A0E9PEY7_ANGAN